MDEKCLFCVSKCPVCIGPNNKWKTNVLNKFGAKQLKTFAQICCYKISWWNSHNKKLSDLKSCCITGILHHWQFAFCQNLLKLTPATFFCQKWFQNWKFQWKLVYCMGTHGYLWELKWNWKFQFFCQKWFQTENFSESWYTVWALMGIFGN